MEKNVCVFVVSALVSVFASSLSASSVQVSPRGGFRERIERNFNRLEEEKYRPDKVFLTDAESGGWPGDTEGRTILGLVLDARATGREPKYLGEILARLDGKLNERGYMGAVLPAGKVDEQQISGNGWMLRGLCEHYLWRPDPKTKERIRTLARNLYLSARGAFAKYPIDVASRPRGEGAASGSRSVEVDGWTLSTDVGCFAIGLDGLVQAWEVTGDAELRPVIDEMVERFLAIDLVAIRAQTHATLTGLRALLRYARACGASRAERLVSEVEKRFALYRRYGMTEFFENVNWFERYECWTEPCAIVDSYQLAVAFARIFESRRDEVRAGEYRELAEEIWWNGIVDSQRANGGFGTHNVPGLAAGASRRKDLIPECHWCCTMRGAEGLFAGLAATAAAEGDVLVVRQILETRIAAELDSGRFVCELETAYPDDGLVTVRVIEAPAAEVTVRFSVPSYLVALTPAERRGRFAADERLEFRFRLRDRTVAPVCPDNAAPHYRKHMHGPRVLNVGFERDMPRETNEEPEEPSYDDLAAGFVDPFGKVQTGCYWYWLSGRISEEGVRRDLAAMKRAGIDRAYIGDVGAGGNSPGKVRTFTDDWWRAIDTAIATADAEGVELGLFNSPGWSQSGGPWITHDKAMRRLAASVTTVTPEADRVALPRPAVEGGRPDEYSDVAVIAYPARERSEVARQAADDRELRVSKDSPLVVELTADEPLTAQSAVLDLGGGALAARVKVEAERDGVFSSVAEFGFSRLSGALNVGFDPLAPAIGAFAPVTAKRFRVTVTRKDGDGAWFRRIALTSDAKVASAAEKTLAKMFESPLPLWNEYQWPRQEEAAPDTALDRSRALVLTERLRADGTLDWRPSTGTWRVYRFGMVPTRTTNAAAVPEATGYEVDKLSAAHVGEHVERYLGKIVDRTPAGRRRAVTTAVLDSYEVGGQNFTDGFAGRFKDAFGYDPTPYLPAFAGDAVASRADTDRFLWDVRRFVADEVAASYVGGLRRACARRGMGTWLECYGHWGFPGEFLQYGGQSDGIAGEFWSSGSLGDIENRAASSCGHVYGKRLIWSESNTSGDAPFARGPMDLKSRTDRFFCEGVNATLLHLYVHQDDERAPGTVAWFGNEFNRKNTWFAHFPLFTGYLKRCNYLLRQGLDVADFAYFIGEDAPKMTGVTDPAVPSGCQFDYINGEVLRESAYVGADGRLTLPHGTAYEVLVLPKLETMRPELLAAIERLVADGAFVLGPKPTRSPSLSGQPAADAKVRELADRLWGEVDGDRVRVRRYGKGRIAWNLPPEEALRMRGSSPDCIAPAPLRFCHRTTDAGEAYFLSNQSADPVRGAEVSFRVDSEDAEIWLPATGGRKGVETERKDGRVSMTLAFASRESYFVVFPRGRSALPATVVRRSCLYEGPWKVAFESDPLHRGPQGELTVPVLRDLSKWEDDAVRHYSGRVVYRTTLEVPSFGKGEKVELDLGEAAVTAMVRLNGRDAGGVCFAPYRLDVTEFVREGRNELEVEVCTRWLNRLIGDAALPESERPTWTSQPVCKAGDRLLPSGLIGPVRLDFMTTKGSK